MSSMLSEMFFSYAAGVVITAVSKNSLFSRNHFAGRKKISVKRIFKYKLFLEPVFLEIVSDRLIIEL